MKKYLVKVENVLKIPKIYIFQDYLTQYQGSKGHSATSDVPNIPPTANANFWLVVVLSNQKMAT